MAKVTNVNLYRWMENHNWPKGNVSGFHSFTSNQSSVVNTSQNDGPIMDYKTKIRRGEFAGSTLSWDGTNIIATPLYVSEAFPANLPLRPVMETVHSWCRGIPYNGSILSDPGTPSTSIADTAALTSLSKRLSSELTTFQGGVFVGELKETIHMLRHPLIGLRRGLSKHLDLVAKRGKRIKKLANMKTMIAETWLETSFGIRPFIHDADDAATALAEFLEDPNQQEFKTLTAKGFHETAKDVANVDVIGTALYSGFLQANAIRKRSVTVKYLTCIGVSPSVRDVSLQKIGVNFASFAPTLWELIPYSFVVDYFTNVGDVISGLANLTAKVRWTMRWTVSDDTTGYNFTFLPNPNNYPFLSSLVFRCPPMSVRKRNILRFKYTGSLVPDFRWELPGLTSLKWANLTALGVQLAATRRIVSAPRRMKLTLLRYGTY